MQNLAKAIIGIAAMALVVAFSPAGMLVTNLLLTIVIFGLMEISGRIKGSQS